MSLKEKKQKNLTSTLDLKRQKLVFGNCLPAARQSPDQIAPKLVSEWLAQIDSATSMDDLELPGFVFHKHHMEFETLDSKTVKGNREDDSG